MWPVCILTICVHVTSVSFLRTLINIWNECLYVYQKTTPLFGFLIMIHQNIHIIYYWSYMMCPGSIWVPLKKWLVLMFWLGAIRFPTVSVNFGSQISTFPNMLDEKVIYRWGSSGCPQLLQKYNFSFFQEPHCSMNKISFLEQIQCQSKTKDLLP